MRVHTHMLTRQIHDEVILEGPAEGAARAKELVMALMANPWAELAAHWADNPPPGFWTERAPPAAPAPGAAPVFLPGAWAHGGAMPLRVQLATDCDMAPTWYEAK